MIALTTLIVVHHRQSQRPPSGERRAERKLERRIRDWHRAERPSEAVVFYGDSLSLCPDATSTRSTTVGQEMMSVLRESNERLRLLDLSHPGLQPLHFYALAGDVLATSNAIVLIEVNLRGFRLPNPIPRAGRLLPLMRNLDIRQSWRARRDLSDNGLDVADPSIMALKDWLGILHPFETARRSALAWLDTIGGLAPWGSRQGNGAERRRRGHRMRYLVDYAAHPKTDTLSAMVSELRAAGASVLVFVAPIDVERLAARGLDRAELSQRLARLREAIGVSPAEWLDLHDTVPSALFREEKNHLLARGCESVGRALAQWINARPSIARSALQTSSSSRR